MLGLGAGWNEPDYAAFGYPFDHRVSRFDEAITIIHGLLRHGQIDFEGEYYSARDCELRPRGPRPAGPPILIGSTAPRMLGLLARYGDIWNAWARQITRGVGGRSGRRSMRPWNSPGAIRRRCRARSACWSISPTRPDGQVKRRRDSAPVCRRSWQSTCIRYAGAGISHVQLMLDPNTPAGIEWAARGLEQLDAG